MKQMKIHDNWQFKRVDEKDWLLATVPGSVYNDLISNNKMEDPFYRDNEDKAFKISDFDFEYKANFNLEASMLNEDNVILQFDGLDTLAEIYLNAQQVSSTDNMHRTYTFNVKPFLKEGLNELHIIFRSPMKYIREKQKDIPLWGVIPEAPGYSHLRKAHYMFGWDWGPSLPDMGIWRSVTLKAWSTAKFNDIYTWQKHTDGAVTLNSRVRFISSNEELSVRQEITCPNGNNITNLYSFDKAKMVLGMDADGISRELIFETLINEPEIWWPNGLGNQPLYNVKYDLLDKFGNLLDADQKTIGLRTLTVCTDKYEWGEKFEFVINGVSIFSMGANYIPEDNILSRVTPEITERLIKHCIKANYNSIRVWGGGIYPNDHFYDLCDQYGLIVWQDFMFACSLYDVNNSFLENIRHEAADNVKRFRHHPSLGLMCGNNEMETAIVDWNIKPINPKDRASYIKQYEVLLPEVCSEHAPDTFYWPASPSSGGGFDNPNDETRGDVHYWSVWHGRAPFTDVRNHYFKFASEFGMQSFPCMKTIESFTLPEDRNIFSYVMEKHQKSPSGNEKILFYISDYLKYPKNLDALAYCSQVLQGEAIRYGVEHWRRNRGRCMGSMYWQVNDCWPVASWSSLDSFYRWKALHYFAKRFYTPVLASVHDEGTKLSFHVTNDQLEEYKGKLTWRLRSNAGAIIKEKSYDVTVAKLSAEKIDEIDFLADATNRELQSSMFVEYELDGISRGTILFVRPKHFNFLKPDISVKVEDLGDHYLIHLASDRYARTVELDLVGADSVFSDNYFDLVGDGVVKTITLIKKDITNGNIESANELKADLKIRSLIDTFE